MKQFAPDLVSLLAVAAATLDEHGRLLEANAGFLRVLDPAGLHRIGELVGPFFVQPDFASLVSALDGAQGKIHQGLLTVEDCMGRLRSLRGSVWRDGGQLRVLAEYDIEGLERLSDTVLQINHDYAHAQNELAQRNLRMQSLNALLEEQKAELQATLDCVKRLEGLLSICIPARQFAAKPTCGTSWNDISARTRTRS